MLRKYSRDLGLLASCLALGTAAALSGCAETTAVDDEVIATEEPTADIAEVGSVDVAAEDVAAEEVATAAAALWGATDHPGRVDPVRLNEGIWGSWQTTMYCPADTRAVGYRMRVEQSRGSGDDTALNAVELQCMDDGGKFTRVSAHDGLYGGWYDSAFCSGGSVMVGGAIRFETSRGSGDDTAANSLSVRCSDGKDIQASGGMGFGGWNTTKTCPIGSSVCGINVRFEGGQGSGDDTALNAVEFACCTDSVQQTRLAVSEYKDDYLHVRTFTPDRGSARAPLIFVEGFDIDGTMSLDGLNDKLPTKMLDNLTRRGYSVSVIDLRRNWDPIASNARRVGDYANRVWAASTKERPMKFVGASMGGLVVATAAAMKDYWGYLGETNPNWTFSVDHISTVDTPHAGAYVPQAVFNISSRFQSHSSSARDLYRALSSQAASQMMLLPFDYGFLTTRTNWVRYYEKVKTALRTSGVMFVGYVNGSWEGVPQYSDWTSGTQNIGWEHRSTEADFDVWAYTQPAPGGIAARVKADFFFVGADEDKYYPTLRGNWPIVENSPGGSLNIWGQLATSLRNTSARFPNVSFVPTWSAAGVSLADYLKLPKAEQDNMTTLEANRGPLAHSPLSPLTKIVPIRDSPNSTHTSLNYDTSLERELFNAFDYTWSEWVNRDDPSFNGDGEHRGLMTNIPCQNPFAVQCRRASDHVDSAMTGEIVRCNLDGGECINAKQPDGSCDDYEVRFACPATTTVELKPRTIPLI